MTALTQVTEPAQLAESPVWDARRQSLLWVDITRGHVHRYDPRSGEDTVTAVGVPVGAVAVRRGGGLVLAAARGFALLDEEAGSLEWLWSQALGDRMNDGKCDPAGRFLAGSLTSARVPGAAALYRLDTDGRVAVLIADVTLSNGLGWSPDGTRLYFADTPLERVDVLDYDVTTGAVSGRRVFADLREVAGRPDGLTVDADGGVWIAMARGGAVRRYRPDGRLDHVVELPVRLVTSVTFGGAGLADLYVTTSREGLGPGDLAGQPQAGAVFCLPASGARGLPANECGLLRCYPRLTSSRAAFLISLQRSDFLPIPMSGQNLYSERMIVTELLPAVNTYFGVTLTHKIVISPLSTRMLGQRGLAPTNGPVRPPVEGARTWALPA